MSDTARIWWRGRTGREQRLLLFMAALLALVLVWALVIRPVGDSLSAARERHAAAVIRLAEARAQAGAIQSLSGAPAVVLSAPLTAILNAAATEAGLPVARVEPEGANRATMVLNNVRPQAFFGWVSQMETRNNLLVERFSATTNSDQTLAVQITFRTRAG
jgi:general secretion pathway protein M